MWTSKGSLQSKEFLSELLFFPPETKISTPVFFSPESKISAPGDNRVEAMLPNHWTATDYQVRDHAGKIYIMGELFFLFFFLPDRVDPMHKCVSVAVLLLVLETKTLIVS